MLSDFLPQIQAAAPVILSLIIIEGLLSVDNMLAIAALAAQLPETQQKKALRLGLIGAYVFRGLALLLAGFILHNDWIKIIGAAYLIHLMADHFSGRDEEDAGPSAPSQFWSVVATIQFMDLSLSVDNVVTAVSMSPELWVVYTGVFLGLLTLWLFSTLSLRLIEVFPILKHTAFLLIGYVGLLLLAEMLWHFHLAPHEKFYGIAAIIIISLIYSKSTALQNFSKPIFHVLMVPVKIYATIVGAFFNILFWPVRKIWSLFNTSKA